MQKQEITHPREREREIASKLFFFKVAVSRKPYRSAVVCFTLFFFSSNQYHVQKLETFIGKKESTANSPKIANLLIHCNYAVLLVKLAIEHTDNKTETTTTEKNEVTYKKKVSLLL